MPQGFRVGLRVDPALAVRRLATRLVRERQAESERRATRGGRLSPDAAVMRFDQPARDGQPQPGAHCALRSSVGARARTLAAIEPFEDALPFGNPDARPGVAHAQHDGAVVNARIDPDQAARWCMA